MDSKRYPRIARHIRTDGTPLQEDGVAALATEALAKATGVVRDHTPWAGTGKCAAVTHRDSGNERGGNSVVTSDEKP